MQPPRQVSLVVFDEAEVLDVSGPYEVFTVAGRRHGLDPFRVALVAEGAGPVMLRNGFAVQPQYTIQTAPPADLLIVPGGFGTRREMYNARLIEWLRREAEAAELVLSVCTGALLLGKAGLLNGLEVTTHHGAYNLLREVAPLARVREGERFVDNGRIIVAAGVSAGIDMALHVVERLLGNELAEEAAAYMEYRWDRNEGGLREEGI
ncbi:MAG TPA: DJ-1/PfpI family protein [Gemmatimonadales bacterium]|jgi:transcriptional regulator GlxA family with amidase domain